MNLTLYHGDCLVEMEKIADSSVDLIACDLPYGTTACKWDTVIPFEPLWAHYRRVLKPRGAVVLTASQPFTSMLVMSNREWFKYEWIWEKSCPSQFIHAKNRPLSYHENILVFSPGVVLHVGQSDKRMPYNPQGLVRAPFRKKRNVTAMSKGDGVIGTRASHKTEYDVEFSNYPGSILDFGNSNDRNVHPTQKPVPLFEYLIRTYSNEGETVLDNCMGSGTTGVACINTGRDFIGIERVAPPGEVDYFPIAERRIAEARNSTPLFGPST